jgi:hypothetical protein
MADPRAMRSLCRSFRDYTGPPVTRVELATLTGAPDNWITEAAEELVKAGYLAKGKKGSRAIYSRTDVERAAYPDLPDDWFYSVHVSSPGGQLHRETVISTGKFSPDGGEQALWPRQIDGVHVASLVVPKWHPQWGGQKDRYDAGRAWVAAEALRRGLEVLDGDVAVLGAYVAPPYVVPGRYDPYPSPPPRGPATGTTELVVWAPLADRPRAEAVAQLHFDRAFKAYRDRR